MGMTKQRRRWEVVVNHVALGLMLAAWYGTPLLGWSGLARAVAALVPLAVVGISYYRVHLATGLWTLVHAKLEELDERQVERTMMASRFSYAVFSVLCLLALFGAAVAGNHGFVPFDAILPAGLLYLAHTLPSSYLAWVEEVV
jgi:hypothetical protein